MKQVFKSEWTIPELLKPSEEETWFKYNYTFSWYLTEKHCTTTI